jgi:flagellar assembly protein FliH
MGRGVISEKEYKFSRDGYVVDNISWQGELKRRAEELVHHQQALLFQGEPAKKEKGDFSPDFSVISELGLENDRNTVREEEPQNVKSPEEETRETARQIEEEAQKKASETTEQARREAEEIVRQAVEKAQGEVQKMREVSRESGQKEGFSEGYEKGLEKGKAEEQQKFSSVIQKWEELFNRTAAERKRLLTEMGPILADLTSESLHQCLKKEAQLNRQMVVGIVEETLKKAHDRVHLKAHLNPEDVKEVEAQKGKLLLSAGMGELEIMPDGRIEPGGCLLETEAGSVDARISTMATQVKQALLQA